MYVNVYGVEFISIRDSLQPYAEGVISIRQERGIEIVGISYMIILLSSIPFRPVFLFVYLPWQVDQINKHTNNEELFHVL